MTGVKQKGSISVAEKKISYMLLPEQAQLLDIPGQSVKAAYGKMYRKEYDINVIPSKGKAITVSWNMDFFYVQKTTGMPDWNKIPAIEMANSYVETKYKKARPANDQKARFKLAWDEKNLYLRVEAEDDHFILSPKIWKQGKSDTSLYLHDGCLEVYFDTGADGRMNANKTYDNNDYRYDFSIGMNDKSGPGMVYRLREVYHQLADGVNMASKKEAAEKIKCDFQITDKGYTYTIVFAQRYLEPIVLRNGFISGFGMYLHDKDNNDTVGCPKGLSLATEKGSHCDYKPHLWPLMILKK